MRQIKFRGRRMDDTIHNGRWVYGHYFTPPLTDENSGLPAESGWFFLSGTERRHCIEQDGVVYTVDPDTVGEWTGFTDTEKVDIYEDDIVRVADDDDEMRDIDTGIGQVEWLAIQGLWYISANLDNGLGDLKQFRNITVIGNVHQNAELLEAKRDV